MSERILKALMQLFALVADVDGVSNHNRKIVELFLKQQLNQDMVNEYLVLYDEFLETYHKVSKKKEGKKDPIYPVAKIHFHLSLGIFFKEE